MIKAISKTLAIGGGKTKEMQANYTILSLISSSIVVALLQQQNLWWAAGTRVHPFLAGAQGRVNGGRFAVIGVENWRNLLAYFALVRTTNDNKHERP